MWGQLLLWENGVHPIDVVECEPELVDGSWVDFGGVMFLLTYFLGMLGY